MGDEILRGVSVPGDLGADIEYRSGRADLVDGIIGLLGEKAVLLLTLFSLLLFFKEKMVTCLDLCLCRGEFLVCCVKVLVSSDQLFFCLFQSGYLSDHGYGELLGVDGDGDRGEEYLFLFPALVDE